MSKTTKYLVIELLKNKIAEIKKDLESPEVDFYEAQSVLTIYEDALNEIEEEN